MKKELLTLLITGMVLNFGNSINVQAKEIDINDKKELDVLNLTEEELEQLNYKKNGDLNNLTKDELEKKVIQIGDCEIKI